MEKAAVLCSPSSEAEVEAQGEVLWSPLLEAKEAEEEQAEVSFLGELLGWVLEKAVAV